MKDLGLEVMDSLFNVGNEYLAELERQREAAKRKAAERTGKTSALKGGKRPNTLREYDPW